VTCSDSPSRRRSTLRSRKLSSVCSGCSRAARHRLHAHNVLEGGAHVRAICRSVVEFGCLPAHDANKAWAAHIGAQHLLCRVAAHIASPGRRYPHLSGSPIH
jgi:hypothetical protein